MPKTETITGSFVTGGSFSLNLSEQVDVSEAQDGSDMETRYYCILSSSFESINDNGEKRQEPKAQRIRLLDSETGFDYKTTRWDIPAIVKALPGALSETSAAGKIENAGYDPKYPAYNVIES